jgi:hypothetical protein
VGHDFVNTGKKKKNKKFYGREINKNGERINLTEYLTQVHIK